VNKILLIIILLSVDNIFPQDSSFFQPETRNYIQLLTNNNSRASLTKIKNLPADSVKIIASIIYKAYDKDYFDLNRYIGSKKKEWERNNEDKIKKERI